MSEQHPPIGVEVIVKTIFGFMDRGIFTGECWVDNLGGRIGYLEEVESWSIITIGSPNADDDTQAILDTYDWIKVKRYVDDETLPIEERYARLEKHHKEETEFLINKIRDMIRI